jgi:L-threonylcarbamoyladenylate synthase
VKEIDLTARADESMSDRLGPAVLALKDGGLVVLPTATYYALCVDALNPDAVRRSFSAKKRDPSKPLITLVDSMEMMRPLVKSIPAQLKELEWRFGAKGITFVVNASERVPAALTAGTGTVAVRLERHEVVQEVLGLLGGPITAPSANIEGQPPPRIVDDCIAQLRDWIDVAVRWWPSQSSRPTTIVDLTGASPSLVREGTVAESDIQRALEGTAPRNTDPES